MNQKDLQFLRLGSIGRPRGLKGEFFVSGRETPWDGSVKRVWLGDPSGNSRKVSFCRFSGNKVLTKLEGINSREDLAEFSNLEIWTTRDQIEIDEEEFLWSDLIGVEVVDSESKAVGIVHGFENFGAHDNIIVQKGQMFLELPFVSEYFNLNFSGRPQSLVLQRKEDDLVDFWREKL